MTVHDARDLRDLLADELAERHADGCDVTTFESEVAAALAEASGPRDLAPAIGSPAAWTRPDVQRLPDQLLGAWLGPCAGNTLGMPVEGWTKAELRGTSAEPAPLRSPTTSRGWNRGPTMCAP
jgi:hypothetical protein